MKKLFNFMVKLLISSVITFVVLLIMCMIDNKFMYKNDAHTILTIFYFMPYVIYNCIGGVKNIKRFRRKRFGFKLYFFWSIKILFDLNLVGSIAGIIIYCLYKKLVKNNTEELNKDNNKKCEDNTHEDNTENSNKDNNKKYKINKKSIAIISTIILMVSVLFGIKKVNLKDTFNKLSENFN